MSNQKNRLALVTGSTAGIGFAVAEKLARRGHDVIINGRTVARVSAAIQQLIACDVSPHRLHGVAADLTTAEGALQIQEMFPAVDVLINNFGAFAPKDFSDISDEDWNYMWTANVMSGIRMSRFYFPKMLKTGYGRVIFISSESALQIPSEAIHYGVSKTAQLAVARGMAELAVSTNVTVNSVLVGPTNSEGMRKIVKQFATKMHATESEIENWFFEHIRPSSRLKRFMAPEEIGAFVAFLAGDEASGITGAALRVDGGVLKSVV